MITNSNSTMASLPSVAVLGSLLVVIVFQGHSQTRGQVNDPTNPVPEYVKRAAENRPDNPSFNDIRGTAAAGAVWPGDREIRGVNNADRKRIKALMSPEDADLEKYREFLRQENTGIFRLYSDFDCVVGRTISVAGDCANQVYMGSKYSFRGSSYFQDLRYNQGKLTGIGFFSHEIFVDIGDESIENLTLDSPKLAFLKAIMPSTDFNFANRQFRAIVAGFETDGLYFARSVSPQLDHTYALRIIAFDNKNSLSKRMYRRKPEPLVWPFRSLHLDKRTDIIVAFRVVRLGEDGNITVVWKQLSKKKAPIINFSETETLKTFH